MVIFIYKVFNKLTSIVISMDSSIGLTNDKLISLYLSRVIPINEIRHRIIKMKTNAEDEDTFEYHNDRWSSIAGSHYIAHDTHQNKFSYIFNDGRSVVHVDHNMDFYNLTGISYQIVELIHELIKIKNDDEICFWDLDNFKKQEEWLKNDDSIFSKLAGLITKEINLKKLNNINDLFIVNL